MLLLALIAFWLWTPDKSRADLEARYLQSPSDIIEITGVRLHVRDSGPKDAPAVILIHGFGGSLHTWDAWAQVLAADHRVIRFDLPGSGRRGCDVLGGAFSPDGDRLALWGADTGAGAQSTRHAGRAGRCPRTAARRSPGRWSC